MSSQTSASNRSFGTFLRDGWNAFARTSPGDTFAALLTIAVMFAAMFTCAAAVILGMDVLQLVFQRH